MAKTILFDYNGVIADDEYLHEKAFRKVLESYGINLTHELYRRYCMGKTDLDGFISLKNTFENQLGNETTDELIRKKKGFYIKAAEEEDVLYEGVWDTIYALNQDFELAIVTSSSADEMYTVLEKNGLERLFTKITTADETTQGKPDPEPYLNTLKFLDTSHEEAVVVEDSKTGVESAKRAGLPCIAVLQTTPKDRLAKADLIINDVTKLNKELVEQYVDTP